MGNYFQMPEFNFRLRRALDPFNSQDTGRKFGGISFNNPWEQEEEEPQIPPFRRSMPDYSQMYEETGPATKRYQQHLSEVPSIKDYAPSKWRRFGAVVSGIGAALGGKSGYDEAQRIAYDPYKTSYEDWMGRGQGLKESATIEEAAANKKAALWQKILSDYIDSQDRAEQREIGWAGVDVRKESNDIARFRAEMEAEVANGRLTDAQARTRIAKFAAESNAAHYQRSDANAATANSIRREGVDVQRYGITQNAYNTKKQRELSERLGQTGAVTSGSQLDARQLATDQMFQEMASDPAYASDIEDYFLLDESGAPIMTKGTLPGKYAQKFQNVINQSYMFSGKR